jgi:hypothetical protein
MTDQPFSNRELKAMFNNIDGKLDAITTQTTKTNGRVNKLEERQDKTDQWQSYMKGGLSVLTLLVVPVVIYILLHWPA